MKRWVTKLGLGATLAMVIGGCAQEREPIIRVQPYALEKKFFVGDKILDRSDDPEFYVRGSSIDLGYEPNQFMFTSMPTPVHRIKWEITEDRLIARLSYQRIPGADQNIGTTPGKEGQAMMAFPITSHFDIRRSYNPSTGEEQNVIEENSNDRPWYEREYIRVDWGQNLLNNALGLDPIMSDYFLFGGIKFDAMRYDVEDPSHPDAPVFEKDYFDITQKVFASPEMITIPPEYGGGTYPACFFGGQQDTNCGPAELKLRISFKKVIDSDYEPMDYDGQRMLSFGAFYHDRYNFNTSYGLLDSNHKRPLQRYNIWEKSHHYVSKNNPVECGTKNTTPPGLNPNRDTDNNGTEDECQSVSDIVGAPGSRCDTFTNTCTLPYSKRTIKPIIYYYHEDKSSDMFEPTEWSATDWDAAMRSAVQSARLVECKKAGGGASCAQNYPMYKGQQEDNEDLVRVIREVTACYRQQGWGNEACKSIADTRAAELKNNNANLAGPIAALARMDPIVILCHNPVTKDDNPLCTPKGWDKAKGAFKHRLGDIRYHAVINVPTNQGGGLWGIMADGSDPVNGEKVTTAITIWNSTTQFVSQRTTDYVRYILGELKTSDVSGGKHIRDWVQANTGPFSGAVLPGFDTDGAVDRIMGTAGPMETPELRDKVKAAFERKLKGQLNDQDRLAIRQLRNRSTAMAKSTMPGQAAFQATTNQQIQKLRGTEIESKLTSPMHQLLAGVNPTNPVSANGNPASPFGINNPLNVSAVRKLRELKLAERGACVVNALVEYSGTPSMAKLLAQKFPYQGGEDPNKTGDQLKRAERIRRYLARRFHYAVMSHEMGHSYGLRHNFVSSYDSFTYRPQYWQVRTGNGTINAKCETAQTLAGGEKCVGPRYFDPVTQDEMDNLLYMWQQSSVMDYPGDLSVDMMGLGAYDFAAARMFYGDVASVIETGQGFEPGVKRDDLFRHTDDSGGLLGITLGDEHYSQNQRKYQVIRDCQPFDKNKAKPSNWNNEADGDWHAVMDGHIVSPKEANGTPTTKRCRSIQVDYEYWKNLRDITKLDTEDSSIADSVTKYASTSHNLDANNRIRFPYMFDSDENADDFRPANFRHDQGADPYEQAMFYITMSENAHIFSDYRRDRVKFSLGGAVMGDWNRYKEKLMFTAIGAGIYRGLIGTEATKIGVAGPSYWSLYTGGFLSENILAASLAFDQFTRQLSRPNDGLHSMINETQMYKSTLYNMDAYSNFSFDSLIGGNQVIIPTGTTGFKDVVGIGGQPMNPDIDVKKGYFYYDYLSQSGSYFQKEFSMLGLTSTYQFGGLAAIDWVDNRAKIFSLAEIFPDGFRRFVANSLTGDPELLGFRIATDATGNTTPFTYKVDKDRYPSLPLGFVSWWPSKGTKTCFSYQGSQICGRDDAIDFQNSKVITISGDKGFNNAGAPKNSVPLDPMIGWELQQRIALYAMLQLPVFQTTEWQNMFRLFRSDNEDSPGVIGAETGSTIVFRDPFSGLKYTAKRYSSGDPANPGKPNYTETIGGKANLEKGISARVLQHANMLAAQAFELDKTNKGGTGNDKIINATGATGSDGIDDTTGELYYKLDAKGQLIVIVDPTKGGLDPLDPKFATGTCNENFYCVKLKEYRAVPEWIYFVGKATKMF